MANKLYVSEFRNPLGSAGTMISEKLGQPSLVDQIVAVGAGSTASNAFSANTNAVLLVTDTACCIAFGADPAADNSKNMLLPANTPMAFTVVPGQKVACITP